MTNMNRRIHIIHNLLSLFSNMIIHIILILYFSIKQRMFSLLELVIPSPYKNKDTFIKI